MSTIRRAWRAFTAPFRAAAEPPQAPQSAERWIVVVDDPGRRYYSPAVVLSGLALDDLIHGVLLDLAQSIHDRDGRAEAWTDYVMAVSNRKAAGDVEDDDLDDAVADAWDELAPELPSHLRLPLAEAQYVEQLLDDAVARVGVEGGRAA